MKRIRHLWAGLLAVLGAAQVHAAHVYSDSEGRTHPWSIDETHSLIWDGKPYLPFGGMFVSSWIHGQREPDFAKDRQVLRQARDAGIDDLYLNVLWNRPPATTQRVIDLLEEMDFRYGIQFPFGARTSAPGYHIDAGRWRIDSARCDDLVLPLDDVLKPPAGERSRALYLVISNASGEVMKSGVVTGSVRGFEIPVAQCPAGGVTVKLVPETLNQNWIDEDATALTAWLRRLEFGAGLRFLLDPIGNEYAAPRNFLPRAPEWRTVFAAWLQTRYGTVGSLQQAWGVTEDPARGFTQLARLVPVLAGLPPRAGRDRGYAVDDGTGEVLAVDLSVSRMWLDMCEAREDFLRTRAQRVAAQLREVVNVPIVVKRHHESTRVWISRDAAQGFDGLGMESYGSGEDLARFNGSATYAEVAQNRRPTWCLVTEFNGVGWRHRQVGYRSRTQLYQDLNELLRLGARGVFMFGLSLHVTPGDANWSIFDLSHDPAQFEWLATFGRAARADTAWITRRPEALYQYPVQSSDARAFLSATVPEFGLSGSWKGERGVERLGAGRWLAPLFYPDALPVVRDAGALKHPVLAREAQMLGDRPKEAVTRTLADVAQAGEARAAEAPVPLRVRDLAEGAVEAVEWTDATGVPTMVLRAKGRGVALLIGGADRIQARWTHERRAVEWALPRRVTLPQARRAPKTVVLNNAAFGVRNQRFDIFSGVAPEGLVLQGAKLDQLELRAVRS